MWSHMHCFWCANYALSLSKESSILPGNLPFPSEKLVYSLELCNSHGGLQIRHPVIESHHVMPVPLLRIRYMIS